MAKSLLLSTSKPLKATLYILFLAITLGYANSARLLDEAQPEASNPLPTTVPTSTLPSGQIPTIAPATTAVDDTVDDADSPLPEIDAPDVAPPVVPPVTTVPQADSPLPETEEPAPVPAPVAGATTPLPSGPVLPVATPLPGPITTSPTGPTPTAAGAGASASVGKPGAETPHLSFFMHDVLGGSHPSVRVVTGLIANTDFNAPFSKPNNNIFPVSGGTPLTNNDINGFLNGNKNIPGIAGLTGITNSQSNTIIQNSGNNNIVSGGNSQPFVTANQLPTTTTLQKLMFGSVTVIDDELTEGHELGSAVMGKAQGFYLASSRDGNSHTMAFTVLLHGEHDVEDTISLFGVHRTASPVSHIAVIGGTGRYENANGYAAIESLHQVDQHTTDGVDTIMQISVYLSE